MNNCKVFTPLDVANEMLDLADYHKNLHGKKVLESACGEGHLLVCIVERYIIDCLECNFDIQYIKEGLENDIWGYDIDDVCSQKCRYSLNQITHKYNINEVKWNIYTADSLLFCPLQRYDYIFGNPPYINYRDIDKNDRNFLKEMYSSCSVGAFDYCYAFLEHDLSCLSLEGKLVYLVPSSIFKNVYAEKLRQIVQKYVTSIIDFTTKKLFSGILTSSAILICEGKANTEVLRYKNAATDERENIAKATLNSDKWIFSSKMISKQDETHKFSEYFGASIVVATLLNKAFILRNASENEFGFVINGRLIEKDIVKAAASPRSLRYKKIEHIIFPYAFNNGQLIHYSKAVFEARFPGAKEHLQSFFEELSLRDTDKSAKWFEYGRSQALSTICQEKLLISTVVTNHVEVYSLSADTVPYAGIYIYGKSSLTLDFAKKILTSDAFLNYVHNIGIHASGESIRITSKDVLNFRFRWPEE